MEIIRGALVSIAAWFTTIVLVYLLAASVAYSNFMRRTRAPAYAPLPEEDKTWRDYAKLAGKTFLVLSLGLAIMVAVSYFKINLLRYLLPFLFWAAATSLGGVVLNPHSYVRQLVIAAVGAGIATVLTMQFPNWIAINALSIICGLNFLILYRYLRVKTTLVLSAAFVVYDCTHVFGTGLMERLARQAQDTPMMMTVPTSAAVEAPPLFMIGLGDLVLPGLLVMLAFRVAKHYRSIALPVITILGVLVGHILTLIAYALTNRGQPALIYILPCAWLFYGLVAWLRGYHDPDLPKDDVIAMYEDDADEDTDDDEGEFEEEEEEEEEEEPENASAEGATPTPPESRAS